MPQRVLLAGDAVVVVSLLLENIDGPLRIAGDEFGIRPRGGERLRARELVCAPGATSSLQG